MKLSHGDFEILRAVATFYAMSSPMIHRWCVPHRKDQRHTRRRLAELTAAQYLRRTPINVAFSTGNSGPVYTPTQECLKALAVYFNDDAWLSAYCRPPRHDRLYHWLDCSWAHALFENACRQTDGVILNRWINEWAPTLDADGNPNGYMLHTQFRETPPLSCSPDAAMVLEVGKERQIVYVEMDRGTSGPTRVIASKMPGFSELYETKGYLRHFPDTKSSDFIVLLITIDRHYRNRLRREVSQMEKLHPELWLIVSREDLTPETALFDSVYVDHVGDLGPLLNKDVLEKQVEKSQETPDAA